MILHIDFETFSAADLPIVGLHNYATHQSTGVHCLAFSFDDEPVDICTDFTGVQSVALTSVLAHVEQGGIVYAHNAAFELQIWNSVCVHKYGWPNLSPNQCRCTMSMAYAMAIPAALENVAPALGIDVLKDARGKRVMLKLAKPKSEGAFYDAASNPTDFEKLYAYCKQDVEVERAIHKRLLELSEDEQNVWGLDYEINQRGVEVDIPNIKKAIALVNTEKARLNAKLLQVTGGVVGSCTEVQLLVKWIRAQGVTVKGLAKADLLALLDSDLPANVRETLNLRREAAKSSTAKLVAMLERASIDGRIRGIHQYHGASTGRWAGRGVQTQNLPRPRNGIKPKHIADIISHLNQRDYIEMMYSPVMDAVADCVRGMIIAKRGSELIEVDFSAIEARVLAWLAGEQAVLDIFEANEDVYVFAAARIFKVEPKAVTKDQRQIGKVAVLALGYGGGVGAFQSMARVYGVHVADNEAETIKYNWRNAHPAIVKYWRELENAAICAIEEGGTIHAGHAIRQVSFKVKGSFLWCKLPSGRLLCYPYPKLIEKETPWGGMKKAVAFMAVNGVTRKWEETTTYGGSLAENITQAVARDLLVEAMKTFTAKDYKIVMHIHDSIVVEIDEKSDESTLKKLEQLMCALPTWATGLPLKAEGWRARRFQK